MDYDEIVAVVKELIADTGRACRFEILSADPADADKPWNGPASPTAERQLTARATFVAHAGNQTLGLDFVAADLLKKAEMVCLVAPVPAAFALDRVTSLIDGQTRWRVDWVQALKPGDTVLLYAVGMSR